MTNPHDTFSKKCRQDALWYLRQGYRESLFIAALKWDVTISTKIPYIQRQSYADRVQLYWLEYRGLPLCPE